MKDYIDEGLGKMKDYIDKGLDKVVKRCCSRV